MQNYQIFIIFLFKKNISAGEDEKLEQFVFLEIIFKILIASCETILKNILLCCNRCVFEKVIPFLN